MSVAKMVIAIGMATAVVLLAMPRPMKAQPSSARIYHYDNGVSKRSDKCSHSSCGCNRTFLVVLAKERSVLNISLRITSRGLVSTAPAMPAAVDLMPDRKSKRFLSLGSTCTRAISALLVIASYE